MRGNRLLLPSRAGLRPSRATRITVTKTIQSYGNPASVLTASVNANVAYIIGGSIVVLLGLGGLAFAWRRRLCRQRPTPPADPDAESSV